MTFATAVIVVRLSVLQAQLNVSYFRLLGLNPFR